MSYVATKALVARSVAKRRPCWLVLTVLAEMADPQGVAFPKISTLVKRTTLPRRTVLWQLQQAEALEELHRGRRGRFGVYHLQPGGIPVGPCGADCRAPALPPAGPEPVQPGGTDPQPGPVQPGGTDQPAASVQPGEPTGATSRAETPSEPLQEPPGSSNPVPTIPSGVVVTTAVAPAQAEQRDADHDEGIGQGQPPTPKAQVDTLHRILEATGGTLVAPLNVPQGPPANGATATHVACQDYDAHRNHHQLTDAGWVCTACATGVPA